MTDGRARRWSAHNARRRDEVLDAALAVIEETGIDATVKQIADRLGLPRPVVYRHFDGRRDLDEQVRVRILERLSAELTPALHPDGTLRDAVRTAIRSYVRWIDRHPRLYHFLGTGSHHEPAGSQVVSGARTAFGSQLATLFAAALGRFDAETALARPMAFGVIGLVDGAVNSWRSDPGAPVSAARLEDLLTTSLLTLIEHNGRALGIPLGPDTPVSALLGADPVDANA